MVTSQVTRSILFVWPTKSRLTTTTAKMQMITKYGSSSIKSCHRMFKAFPKQHFGKEQGKDISFLGNSS